MSAQVALLMVSKRTAAHRLTRGVRIKVMVR
jgi:hypothetical protein